MRFFRWAIPLCLCAAVEFSSARAAQIAPQSATTEVLLSKAAEAERNGMYMDALGDYQAAARAIPSDAAIFVRIGLVKGRAGDFEGAKQEFAHAIALDPASAEAHYNLGLALLGGTQQTSAWAQALEQFEAALRIRKNYPEATNMAGVCLLETGETGKAETLFRAALAEKPEVAGVHFNLGRTLEAEGNADAALAEYTSAAKLRQPNPEAEMAIANLLYGRNDFRAAAEHFEAVVAADPEVQEAYYKLAQALRQIGDARQASVELRQAAALIKTKSNAVMSSHLSNESLNQAKAGNLPGAIEDARKAVWLNPSNPAANYNLGLLLADSGRFEAALLQFRKAISLAPLTAAIYGSFARAEEKLGNVDAARAAMAKAIHLNPDDPALQARAHTLQAQLAAHPDSSSQSSLDFPWGAGTDTADGHLAFATQLSKEGDFLGAVGELIRATAMQPARSDLRYSLGVVRAQLGQLDEAELDFRKALRQTPTDPKVRSALGAVLFSAKKYADAAREYRSILAADPHNQDAARMLAHCSGLSKN